MNRHEIRKEVFKAVFMNEFHDTKEMEEVIKTVEYVKTCADEIKNANLSTFEQFLKAVDDMLYEELLVN